jgi:hypothetical protein
MQRNCNLVRQTDIFSPTKNIFSLTKCNLVRQSAINEFLVRQSDGAVTNRVIRDESSGKIVIRIENRMRFRAIYFKYLRIGKFNKSCFYALLRAEEQIFQKHHQT